MKMPEEIKYLISQFLDKVKKSPLHQLEVEDRLTILESFGFLQWYREENSINKTLWISPASKVVSFLSVITANHVLPVWEQSKVFDINISKDYFYYPRNLINSTQDFLNGKIEEEEAKTKLKGDYLYFEPEMKKRTTKNVYSVVEAGYIALKTSLYGFDSLQDIDSDFLEKSLDAYAGIDENEPGSWDEEDLQELYSIVRATSYSKHIILSKELTEIMNPLELLNYLGEDIKEIVFWSQERLDRINNYKPFKHDKVRKLEFWQWWLSEAIPQAWKLAQGDS